MREKQQKICEHMNKQENSTIKNRTAWLINLCLLYFPSALMASQHHEAVISVNWEPFIVHVGGALTNRFAVISG